MYIINYYKPRIHTPILSIAPNSLKGSISSDSFPGVDDNGNDTFYNQKESKQLNIEHTLKNFWKDEIYHFFLVKKIIWWKLWFTFSNKIFKKIR